MQNGTRVALLAVPDTDGSAGRVRYLKAVAIGLAVAGLPPAEFPCAHQEDPIMVSRRSASSVSRPMVAAPESAACRRCSYRWLYRINSPCSVCTMSVLTVSTTAIGGSAGSGKVEMG